MSLVLRHVLIALVLVGCASPEPMTDPDPVAQPLKIHLVSTIATTMPDLPEPRPSAPQRILLPMDYIDNVSIEIQLTNAEPRLLAFRVAVEGGIEVNYTHWNMTPSDVRRYVPIAVRGIYQGNASIELQRTLPGDETWQRVASLDYYVYE